MMQIIASMQQEHLAKQQQMIRDDPECKDIMDRQTIMQQQILAAMKAGNQSAVMQAQSEMLELQKHPKYLQLMMPTKVDPSKILFGKNTRATPSPGASAFATSSNPPSTSPWASSEEPAPSAPTAGTGGNKPDVHVPIATAVPMHSYNAGNAHVTTSTMQSMGGMPHFYAMNGGNVMNGQMNFGGGSNMTGADSMFSDMLNSMGGGGMSLGMGGSGGVSSGMGGGMDSGMDSGTGGMGGGME